MSFFRTAQNFVFHALERLPVRPRIRIMSGGCGFFSDVFMSFSGIQACRRFKMSGEIFWGRRSLYFDKQRGRNAHTHFFQSSQFDFSDETILRSVSAPYFPGGFKFMPNGNERPRVVVKRLIDRYASPISEILSDVDEFWGGRLAGMTVLGVHVRGTDALAGFEQRQTQSPEAFLAESEKWLQDRPAGVIFLATDDEAVVHLFRAKLGDRVHFTNAMRSKTGASIHGHLDGGVAGNPYGKGREALIDALLLSRCAFVIRGFSFLTAYSLCYNPDLQFLDLDRQNLGIKRTPWLHL